MSYFDYLISAGVVLAMVILIKLLITYIVWWNVYKREKL